MGAATGRQTVAASSITRYPQTARSSVRGSCVRESRGLFIDRGPFIGHAEEPPCAPDPAAGPVATSSVLMIKATLTAATAPAVLELVIPYHTTGASASVPIITGTRGESEPSDIVSVSSSRIKNHRPCPNELDF